VLGAAGGTTAAAPHAEARKQEAAGASATAPAVSRVSRSAGERGSPDAEAQKALKREAATAHGERDKVAAELKKANDDLARTRADLTRLLTTNAEVPALRERIEQLQRLVAEKEKLLREKERTIADKEAALSALRSEREAAVDRAEKLAATVEGQNRRLDELDAFQRRMAGTTEELEQLRTTAAQLKEDVEARCGHIAQLQADLTKTGSEAALLREQIEANGNAIGQLQDKLTSREAELEALRSHFDREASDLKKRAEQEMWVIRRRLRRVHRIAALGGVAAACLVMVLGYSVLGKSRRISNLEAELAGGAAAPRMMAFNPIRPPMAGPQVVNAMQPGAPTVVATPRRMPTTLMLPTVSEPPGEASRTPTSAGHAARPPEPVTAAPAAAIGPAAAARPAAAVAPVAASYTPRPTAPAAAAPAAAAPAALNGGARVVTYTVKKGDTLGAISQRFLNDAAKWRAIAKENGIQGSQIREGMELHITVASAN
jgi:LysM repeat protein/uncharacterized protein YoxC